MIDTTGGNQNRAAETAATTGVPLATITLNP